eukprot:gene11581-26232_t
MPYSWCEPLFQINDWDRDGWFTAWVWDDSLLSPAQVLPFAKDCLFKILELRFNATTEQYSGRPGVELDPFVDFGGVSGIMQI